MTVRFAKVTAVLVSLFVITASCASSLAQDKNVKVEVAEWSGADHAETIPLRDMAPKPVKEGHHEGAPLRLLPRKGGPVGTPQGTPDTALQTLSISAPSVGNVNSFDGVGQGAFGFVPNAAPPDTNMAVGATQVVQWVNESFAV